MKEQNLYLHSQQLKEVNHYLLIALIAFCYYVTVNIWYYSIPKENEISRFFHALTYIAPAIYLALPVELLILGITLRRWQKWSGTYRRTIIVALSGGVVLIWLSQQIFHF